MKKYFNPLLIIMVLSTFFCVSVNARSVNDLSAVGYWTTISDEDNKPRSVVHIIKKQGMLEGRILKVYTKEEDHTFCIHCTGKLKNKPIIGMRFLWGLRPNGDKSWSSGSIIDPKNGKTYHCKVSLDDSGKKLYVRGYIGISIFGRTQTWVRRQRP